MTDYQAILKELAPCGLDCSRCASYNQGEIKKLITRLLTLLQTKPLRTCRKTHPVIASRRRSNVMPPEEIATG